MTPIACTPSRSRPCRTILLSHEGWHAYRSALFESDVRYVVPLYQRPYVWNEEDQWAPLWDDITALLQHQEGDELAMLWSHFLGAVVLDQENTAPGQIPRFTVIDGQQRLTTLQLIVAAAAKAMGDVGAENDAALLQELTTNNPRRVKGDERLKVWPTSANRAAFVAVMSSNGSSTDRWNDTRNRINDAFDYFTARVTEYLTGAEEIEDEPFGEAAETIDGGADTPPGPSGKILARVERLRITLCDLLKVVSITLEGDDNAQVIFETLNARGTPLLALDLVKNAVFRQATSQGCDTDHLYEQVWRPELDDGYWRRERRQGRLNRPVAELFLMHWLTMKLERVIPATELFATFRQNVLTSDADAEALIRELRADAVTMRAFDTPEAGSSEADFFARLTVLDAGTVLPIVLLLFRSPEIDRTRRVRALRMLESWLARRALMRLTAKNYNRLVPRLVARMKADLVHADDVLLQALSGSEGEISRWPDDEEFINFLSTRDVYGWVAQPRLVMALAAAEMSLHSTKTDIRNIPSNLSLEHILPNDWEDSWPLGADGGELIDGEVVEQAAAERAARLHKLGNLTIVTQPLNSAMSNAPWSVKRAELNRHTRLLLNARIAERDTWDEQAIDERGTWLAHTLAKVWPGPDPANW
ncbi:DUF262 domain-containing protein [Actinomadura physcomitrii]|uniref:DUF262 domain-containing protein n=1 Tax=Actinomadura physcomitrii TaxID=2650748 RepID=UPI002E2626DE